jgi:tetratricopeptide (TPR) repeat protein
VSWTGISAMHKGFVERDNPEALLWIGLNHYHQERYEEALPYFSRLIELVPANATAWATRGYCYLFLDQNELALHDLDKALALLPPPPYEKDPNDLFLVLYSRALALFLLKRYAEAATAFDAAARLGPLPVDGALSQAESYLMVGRRDLARATYHQALLSAEPGAVPTDAWLKVALALLELGDHAAALETTQTIIHQEPWNIPAWIARAQAEFALGRYDECLKSAERTLALGGQTEGVWKIKGAALHQLKRYAEAQVAWRRAYILSERLPAARTVALRGELAAQVHLRRWLDVWSLLTTEARLRVREWRGGHQSQTET